MLSSLRPVGLVAATRRVVSLTMEARLGALRSLASADGPSGAQSAEGVKTVLRRHLVGVDKPLTSEELWQRVESEGVRSKRHMKLMLQQMKMAKIVATKPLKSAGPAKKGKQFGYELGPAAYETKELRAAQLGAAGEN